MRIIGKNNLQSGQPGTIQLIVDNAEELWDLYNILEVGDSIRLATSRKVQHDTGSKTTSFKKTITITLKIEDIQFSPNSINIKGKITQSVPKKKAYSKHDAKENKFFNKILNQFIKQINFENTKVLIIAGP